MMPWTEITRRDHDRCDLRYASDCRDEEWELIAPIVTKRAITGRPRTVDMRAVWEAIQYIAATGCQSLPAGKRSAAERRCPAVGCAAINEKGRQLPKDFPPVSTVRYHFYRMRDDGTFTFINEILTAASRLVSGREAEPTAAIIDSQSVKTTESGGVSGYDATSRRLRAIACRAKGKKIKGRKRHITVDTQGNLLSAEVHSADIQDRDGAPDVIEDMLDSFPEIVKLFADGGYAGDKLEVAMLNINGPAIEIVRRPNQVTGFVVVARRWVVERTLAWLGRCRRLAKNWERTIFSSEAWLLLAAIRRQMRYVVRQVKLAQQF